MAEVYRAYDMRRRITVALKFLRDDLAEDTVFLRRFRREAKVLETLQHPNVVRYFGFEECDDLHFLVVEFISGEGLRRKLSRLDAPLTLGQALHILEPVCNALHYAHAEGIFHCDVKPANIMIDHDGRIVVADFGISKLAESATLTYGSSGTPAYMAPEQCRGQKVDARTDIYALGITTFEMLTLDRPFIGEIAPIEGAISERIRWEHLKAPPPSPRKYNPEIPEWAENAILKALQKRRNRRFASVLAFYNAISGEGKVAPDPILPWSPGAPPQPTATPRVEAIAPGKVPTRKHWDQRVNDALWTLRRTSSRASNFVSQLPARIPSIRTIGARLGGTIRTAASAAARRIPGRAVLFTLVALALIITAVAIWSPPRNPIVPAQVTATKTVPSTGPALSPAPARATLVVQAQAANVRTGPSTLYPVRAIVREGDTFEILARSASGKWYNICCVENREGWIHADLVQVVGDTTHLSVITPTPPAPQQIGATSTPTRPATSTMPPRSPTTQPRPSATATATRLVATPFLPTIAPARTQTPTASRPTATTGLTSVRPVATLTAVPR